MEWQQTPDGKRRWPSAIEVVTADRDRLAALNAELVAALLDQIMPREMGWRVTDWEIRDANARALIAKARDGKG